MMKIIILTLLYIFTINLYPNDKKIETDLKNIEEETDYKKKITVLNKIYKDYPNYKNRDDLGYELANLYILNNDNKNAILILKDILTTDDNNDEASFLLASLYLSDNSSSAAIKIYNELLENNSKKDSNYYYTLYGIANCYIQMGSYYEARGNYERIIKDYEDFDDMSYLMYNLALSYEGTKNYDLALKTYSNIVDTYPNTYSEKMASQKLTLFSLQKVEDKMPDKQIDKQADKPKVSDVAVEIKVKIFPSSETTTFQMGRFRDKKRAEELKSIIKNIGYDSYVKEENKDNSVSYVVRVDLPSDKRNVDELRKRMSSENIPFFAVKK